MFEKIKERFMEPRHPKINLELNEKEGEGIYSNLVVVAYSSAEFIIDFARLLPGNPKAKVHSRIIMTPQHATGLMKTLEVNIKKYENQFDKIQIHQQAIPDDKVVGFKTSPDEK